MACNRDRFSESELIQHNALGIDIYRTPNFAEKSFRRNWIACGINKQMPSFIVVLTNNFNSRGIT